MTHDYKRHGTTTLFATLDVLEGKVIGLCMQPSSPGIIRFLNAIEAQVPGQKIVHVISVRRPERTVVRLTRLVFDAARMTGFVTPIAR